MKYIKDQLTGAVRAFDEENPKKAKRLKQFMDVKMFDYEDGKAVEGGKRWRPTTVSEFEKFTGKKKG